MAGYWLKLYTEILEDPKYYRMSDTGKLGMYELFLLAKKSVNGDGELPTVEDIAFYTRRAEEWWNSALTELEKYHIVEKNAEGMFYVRNFKTRQAPIEATERARQNRAIKNKNAYETYASEYEKYGETETEKIKNKSRGEVEQSNPPPAPSYSITQTGDPFTTQVFSAVTGMTAIPGGDLPKVLPAIDALRSKYPSVETMAAYLRPYYAHWQTKKTKDGRPFSKSNCAWLYDWAVAGDPLPTDKRGPLAKPDPDCPKCGGLGMYRRDLDVHDPNFGKLVKCDCVKVREEVEA